MVSRTSLERLSWMMFISGKFAGRLPSEWHNTAPDETPLRRKTESYKALIKRPRHTFTADSLIIVRYCLSAQVVVV